MGAAQSPGYRASMGVSTAISGLEVLRSPQGQQLGQPCDLHVQHPVAAAPKTYSPTPLTRNTRQNSGVSIHRKANWGRKGGKTAVVLNLWVATL